MLQERILSVTLVCTVDNHDILSNVLTTIRDGWNRDATSMTRNDFGVWEVTLPANDGQLAIPHGTKVKV